MIASQILNGWSFSNCNRITKSSEVRERKQSIYMGQRPGFKPKTETGTHQISLVSSPPW